MSRSTKKEGSLERWISASQIDTYESCNRFWFFQRMLKLQEPPQDHFTFGTVLHAVCERYLSATDNGRVPEHPGGLSYMEDGPLEGQMCGRTVSLYPKDWKVTTERDGSKSAVTDGEGKLIKKLVAEAIENGVLSRAPGTQVERELLLPVIDGVMLIGYIDVFREPGKTRPLPMLEDHKSYGKSSGRYLLKSNPDSPNYLGSNQQLKTYCWAVSEEDGWTGDLNVKHNQFPKFPGKEVTEVETTISRETVEDHGEYLRDVARRIQLTAGIKKWQDVPGPKDTGKCARWYGKPCPFSGICGHTETIENQRNRIKSLMARRNGTPQSKIPLSPPKGTKRKATEATTMSIFDRAKKQKAARAANKDAAGTKEAVASINSVDPTPKVTAAATNGAPWALTGCPACKGRGMTKANKACPICDQAAKKKGLPTSMSYVVEVDEEGLGIAVARDDDAEAIETAGYSNMWIEADEVDEATAGLAEAVEPEPTPEPEAKPAAKEAPTEAPQEEAKPKASVQEEAAAAITSKKDTKPKTSAVAKGKGGRPGVGLTIMVGCAFQRGDKGRKVLSSEQVLAIYGAEMAADFGAESYYDLDTFKRREAMAKGANAMVAELAKHIVVHVGVLGNDDVGNLVRVLMSATEGVEAVITGTV